LPRLACVLIFFAYVRETTGEEQQSLDLIKCDRLVLLLKF